MYTHIEPRVQELANLIKNNFPRDMPREVLAHWTIQVAQSLVKTPPWNDHSQSITDCFDNNVATAAVTIRIAITEQASTFLTNLQFLISHADQSTTRTDGIKRYIECLIYITEGVLLPILQQLGYRPRALLATEMSNYKRQLGSSDESRLSTSKVTNIITALQTPSPTRATAEVKAVMPGPAAPKEAEVDIQQYITFQSNGKYRIRDIVTPDTLSAACQEFIADGRDETLKTIPADNLDVDDLAGLNDRLAYESARFNVLGLNLEALLNNTATGKAYVKKILFEYYFQQAFSTFGPQEFTHARAVNFIIQIIGINYAALAQKVKQMFASKRPTAAFITELQNAIDKLTTNRTSTDSKVFKSLIQLRVLLESLRREAKAVAAAAPPTPAPAPAPATTILPLAPAAPPAKVAAPAAAVPRTSGAAAPASITPPRAVALTSPEWLFNCWQAELKDEKHTSRFSNDLSDDLQNHSQIYAVLETQLSRLQRIVGLNPSVPANVRQKSTKIIRTIGR